MIIALLAIAAVAFVFETAGLFYCAIRNVAFGLAFGAAVFVQISIPPTFMAIAFAWDYFSTVRGGLEPFGGSFSRGFQLYLIFLPVGFIVTLVAGLLGLHRIYVNDQTRNV